MKRWKRDETSKKHRGSRKEIVKSDLMLPSSSSLKDRLVRAVKSINSCALRFTRPGSRWIAASVKFGFIMKAAAIPVGVVVLAVQSFLGHETQAPSGVSRGGIELILLTLVLAPLLETAQIWLVHALVRRWFGVMGFVLVSTLLAYMSHGTTYGVPIVSALVFTFMSYQYVSFRGSVGAGRAFAGVAVSHAVYNSVATSLVLAGDAFKLEII